MLYVSKCDDIRTTDQNLCFWAVGKQCNLAYILQTAYFIGKKIQINYLIDSYNFTSPGENGPAISRFFFANYNLPLFAQNPYLMTELPDNLVVLQNRRKNMLQFRIYFAKSAYYNKKKYNF